MAEQPLIGQQFVSNRSYSMFGGKKGAGGAVQSGVNMQIPGLKELQKSISDLSSTISSLEKAMKQLAAGEEKVKKYFDTVKSGVKETDNAVQGLGSTTSSNGAGGKIQSFLSNVMPTLNMPQGTGGLGAILGGAASVGTFGLNYFYNRAEQLRGTTVNAAQMLGPMSSATGLHIDQLMGQLGKGVPYGGDMNNVLGAMDVGRSMGFNLYGGGASQRRGVSFGQGVQTLQNLYPGVGAQTLAGQFGSMLSSNSGNKAWYLMGGVPNYSSGAVPKSFAEWAEGFLGFFQNQRPGSDRGKAFTKEELQSQMFPGSNINAWFQANQVPPTMIDAWWNYVITKATAGNLGAGVGGPLTQDQIQQVRGPDLARQRLVSESVYARRDLQTGGSLYKSFSQRETTDQTFARILGSLDKVLMGANSIFGKMISFMPTPVADVAMGMVNDLPTMLGSLFTGLGIGTFNFGDPVGDPLGVGDGPYGNTTTSGLHPDLASGVSAMMAANPRLRITSGARSAGKQESMHRRGVGRVGPNGKSNHTRGWAADLGPSSQHRWIAANAKRFGLQHFGSHGEPWHVQLPGVGPGDPAGDSVGDVPGWGILKGAANTVKGWAGSAVSAATGGASDIVGMMSTLFGAIGGGIDKLGSFASNLFSGNIVQGLLSIANPVDLMKNIGGSLFSALNLPDFLNPFKLLSGDFSGSADDIANSFMSMLLGGAGAPGAGSDITSGLSGNALKLSQRFGVSSMSGYTAPDVSAMVGLTGVANTGGGAGTTPAYTGGRLTMDQVAQYAYAAGFRGQDLINMVAIARRESNLSPTAHNPNRATGDDSYGLWQINMLGSLGPSRLKAFGISSSDQLYDPATAAHAAYVLYQQSGGTLKPWGGYKGVSDTHGADQYLADAATAVHNAGLGDPYGGMTPGMYSAMYAPTTHVSSTSAPITVINHITIPSGSMGDGLDVRYVAKRLASANVEQIQSAFEGAH